MHKNVIAIAVIAPAIGALIGVARLGFSQSSDQSGLKSNPVTGCSNRRTAAGIAAGIAAMGTVTGTAMGMSVTMTMRE